MKVINGNPGLNYHLEFYSDTVVVRRDVNLDIVHFVLPNPFIDKIGISFSSVITQQIHIRLFDMSGRLVREEISTPNSVYYEIDKLSYPPGVYVLSIQVGEEKATAYKLFTTGGE